MINIYIEIYIDPLSLVYDTLLSNIIIKYEINNDLYDTIIVCHLSRTQMALCGVRRFFS